MKLIRRLTVLFLFTAGAYLGYQYLNRPPDSLVLTGIVTTHDVIVSPQVGGKLQALDVVEGQQVKRDDRIALIAPDELRAERSYALQQAEGLTSQVAESQAAVRYEEKQTAEQIPPGGVHAGVD